MEKLLIKETVKEMVSRGTFLFFAYRTAQQRVGCSAPLTVERETAIYEAYQTATNSTERV